jgi:hypothetical protein
LRSSTDVAQIRECRGLRSSTDVAQIRECRAGARRAGCCLFEGQRPCEGSDVRVTTAFKPLLRLPRASVIDERVAGARSRRKRPSQAAVASPAPALTRACAERERALGVGAA